MALNILIVHKNELLYFKNDIYIIAIYLILICSINGFFGVSLNPQIYAFFMLGLNFILFYMKTF